MWYYYGNKMSLAKFYPSPSKDTIIEPFCGSAQYSLYGDNYKKNVILWDKDKTITDLWDYLINHATKEEILSLPNIEFHESVENIDCHPQLKVLMGFCINRGVSKPVKTASNYNSWNYAKNRIANDLYKIKHWEIHNGSYDEIKNIDATWFIDPPYQFGGEHYVCSNKLIDFEQLGQWCKSRKGQIIVCENMSANWLDFKPLKSIRGGGKEHHITTEALWYSNNGLNNEYIDNIFDMV